MPFDISEVFIYHAPHSDQPERYRKIRQQARDMADVIEASCPESREKSLAFTNLQQAVMWANASIAINEREP